MYASVYIYMDVWECKICVRCVPAQILPHRDLTSIGIGECMGDKPWEMHHTTLNANTLRTIWVDEYMYGVGVHGRMSLVHGCMYERMGA